MRIERGLGKLFRKKKNGKPVGCWRFRFAGGQVSTDTKDRKAAEQFRKEYVAHQGVAPQTNREVTVNDVLALVKQDYLRHNLRSLDRLKSRIKAIGDLIGDDDARTFTAASVAAYIDRRIREGLKPRKKGGPRRRPTNATINRELETVRRGFRLAVEDGLLFRAPRVRKLREDNEREVHLLDQDWAALIAELREPVRLLVVLAIWTGWRVGRLLNLQWPQIDWEAGMIRPEGGQARNKWVGPAPLFDDLRKALLMAQAQHEKDWPNIPWVLHRNGRKILNYRKEFERARKKIGRPDLHLHDARHHSASRLLDAGVDEARVMRILGHKTPAMLKRYRLVADRHIRDAGRKLDAWVARKAELENGEQPETVN
jgi:integrase